MTRTALAGLIVLAGCVSAVAPPTGPALFTLDPNGIQIAGTPLRIDFSRAQSGVIDTVSRLQASAPDEIVAQSDCGVGPVTAANWDNGLTLNFIDGDFRGWTASGPALRTTSGIASGMTRADIPNASFMETSLGTEFQSGEIFGILDDTGTDVALIWSGVTCFLR